jgi:hypothetical protein
MSLLVRLGLPVHVVDTDGSFRDLLPVFRPHRLELELNVPVSSIENLYGSQPQRKKTG